VREKKLYLGLKKSTNGICAHTIVEKRGQKSEEAEALRRGYWRENAKCQGVGVACSLKGQERGSLFKLHESNKNRVLGKCFKIAKGEWVTRCQCSTVNGRWGNKGDTECGRGGGR